MRRIDTRSRRRRPWITLGLLAALGIAPSTSRTLAQSTAPVGGTPNQEIRELIDRAHYREAEARARELVAVLERDGASSLATARALDLLVESIWRANRGHEAEARELAERAERIKREVVADPVEHAVSLRNLAIVLESHDEIEKARGFYERIIEIQVEQRGPWSPAVARAKSDLAFLLWSNDRLRESALVYEEILEIHDRNPGGPPAELARALNNLAIIEHDLAQYDKARSHYDRAIAIRETLPDRALDLAWSLNGLAVLQEQLGDYDAARELYLRVLAIRETELRPDHLHVGWVLNNLGKLEHRAGNYVEALTRLERALRIEVQELGPAHLDVAMTKGNLGDLLLSMGDTARAREHHEQALRIRRDAPGENDLEIAASLHRLGHVLTRTGDDLDRARALYEQALEIWRRLFGEVHSRYALGLHGLAELDARRGDLASARTLHEEALRIREELGGTTHPDVARSRCDLAGVLRDSGNYADATRTYRLALESARGSVGPDHPWVGRAKAELARVHGLSGDVSASLDAALDSERIGRTHLRSTARFLPERQALRYAGSRPSGLSVALSLAGSGLDGGSIERVWDEVVRSRGTVLDEMALRRRHEDPVQESELARLTDELTQAIRRVANLTFRESDLSKPEQYERLLRDALDAKERAERALAERRATTLADDPESELSLSDLVDHLPNGSALVAFARYELSTVGSDRPAEPSPSYLAFTFADEKSGPFVVNLGPAEEIEKAIERWRDEVTTGWRRSARAEAIYRTQGSHLRKMIWDPVAEKIGEAERVFVVPDGALYRVDFSTLPASSDRYLIETGPSFHYLSAERDLAMGTAQQPDASGLLALGGADFNTDAQGSDDPADVFRGTPAKCGHLRNHRFEALPASGLETRDIAVLWKRLFATDESVVHLTGAAASEDAFKRHAPGKRVVHLATHGFFLGDRCPATDVGQRGIGGLTPREDPVLSPILAENPLLLSGLALAGANRRESGGSVEDGILTAEEIATVDLRGVEWAVLSACDTAVGTVQPGEGILGLWRAFQIAGARTVIMNLWEIDDEMARSWMRELYERRLMESYGTTRAVQEAGLALLQQRRSNELSTHPFYWGGFVAAGDWR